MNSTTIKWEGAGTPLPDGHRIFETHEGPEPGTSQWAIADESGDTPDQTDDGILWLDPTRCLSVARDESFDPPREHISIPLLTSEGERTRTPSDAATVLYLSRMLRWTIEDETRGHYYNAR